MSKRKCLTIKEKISLLNDVESGIKKKDVAAKYGIPANSVSTILKNKDSILSKAGEVGNSNAKRVRLCVYDDVDQAVLKWIHSVRDQNLPLSGSLIKEKALQFANALGYSELQASVGWLDKFKKRHMLVHKVVSGESVDVSDESCEQWKNEVLKPVLKEYQPKDVFNCDEMGLFFKCLPDKTLTFKGDKCFGGKRSKDRITVLVTSNMTGEEKLKLLVIGKSKNPRCFKGIKSLEVNYQNSRKAWMTGEIFEKWLLDLDKKFGKEKRKIALFVDNCPSHPPEVKSKVKNIKLIFLPPNTTSKLQPMDQGIIKNLKVYYRKRILRKMIACVEENQQFSKTYVDLRTCISELSKAWQSDVKVTTISNSFRKAGFAKEFSSGEQEQESHVDSEPDVTEIWDGYREKNSFTDDVNLEDFLTIDDGLSTTGHLTEEEILDSIVMSNDEDEDQDTEIYYPSKPSTYEIRKAFDTIRCGLQYQEDVPEEVFKSLHSCEEFYEKCVSKVQQKITDYFQCKTTVVDEI
ncbi:tigger transposable element-derived protein 4-like [Uloborus diversus]|uniref:tigger transposable element-derived protein 4-like n=1 Tax=Uloborus diversus TaxID=327109 RepID=UPI002409B879|nr:tigger transposable element-derived protein 4-like [Uloborus diversus]XP_054709230.1 tigger transposable element-derived protein 4-like [Uloborus diversus]